MHRELVINISEDFAVLCSFWNRTPKQIIQYYLEHVSMSAMLNRLGVDPRQTSGFSKKELNEMVQKLVNDPYGLATFFTISFVSPRQRLSLIR